ncbi:MAG: hypothetical protein PVI86_19845, partial [Phycisphaerae bacterium]
AARTTTDDKQIRLAESVGIGHFACSCCSRSIIACLCVARRQGCRSLKTRCTTDAGVGSRLVDSCEVGHRGGSA